MPALVFQCPVTGRDVQGFVAVGLIGPETIFVPVDCMLCGRPHLVNTKTSKSPGTDGPC